MNKLIFKCKFGSHMYGTNTENSDSDFKGIFIPDGKDLILQKATKTINETTKKNNDQKNKANDIDTELFSIQQYLKLLCEGQTLALDMLFCQDEMVLEETYEWKWIKEHKDYFIHKGTSAFVGYTRAQAAKYGVKGFRVAALREILVWLDTHGTANWQKLYEILQDDEIPLPKNENIKLIDITDNKGRIETYLNVCD